MARDRVDERAAKTVRSFLLLFQLKWPHLLRPFLCRQNSKACGGADALRQWIRFRRRMSLSSSNTVKYRREWPQFSVSKVLFVPTVLVMLEFACLVDWIDESALLSPVGVVVWTLFSQNGWTFIPDYCNNTLAFVSYGPAQQFDTFRLQSQANSREERHSSNMYRCHRSRDSTTRPESKYHWKNISLS